MYAGFTPVNSVKIWLMGLRTTLASTFRRPVARSEESEESECSVRGHRARLGESSMGVGSRVSNQGPRIWTMRMSCFKRGLQPVTAAYGVCFWLQYMTHSTKLWPTPEYQSSPDCDTCVVGYGRQGQDTLGLNQYLCAACQCRCPPLRARLPRRSWPSYPGSAFRNPQVRIASPLRTCSRGSPRRALTMPTGPECGAAQKLST